MDNPLEEVLWAFASLPTRNPDAVAGAMTLERSKPLDGAKSFASIWTPSELPELQTVPLSIEWACARNVPVFGASGLNSWSTH